MEIVSGSEFVVKYSLLENTDVYTDFTAKKDSEILGFLENCSGVTGDSGEKSFRILGKSGGFVGF